MKIFIASDHAAFDEKNLIRDYLIKDHEVIDLGAYSKDSTHYPEWAKKLVGEVLKNNAFGILLCGSGIGVSMVANRYKGIRAALCRDEDDAKMARLHNNANVICLSGRKTKPDQLIKMVHTFLNTPFEAGRHQTRIEQFNDLGE